MPLKSPERVTTDTHVLWRKKKRPQDLDSARAKVIRRIKGARNAHKTIRASGRVCCQEAYAAFMANVAKRRALKATQAAVGPTWSKGQADLAGI